MDNDVALQLRKVNRVKPIEKIIQDIDQEFTVDYYKKTNRFYRKYHSKEGAMHFGWRNSDGDPTHYFQHQSNEVHAVLQRNQGKKILELGCGPGYNLKRLAEKNPGCMFWGLDITPLHLQQAKEASSGMENVNYFIGDFERSTDLTDIDLIYAIETTCHASDIENVLQHSYHTLNEKGSLMIFDAFHNDKIKSSDADTKLAGTLFAQGFAIKRAQFLSEIIEKAEQIGFRVKNTKDLTKEMIQNLTAFHKGSSLVFRYPILTKVLLSLGLLPNQVFRHSISGLVGPYLFSNGFTGYYQLEFEKPGTT